MTDTARSPVRRLARCYGANPLHLLALLASFALAGYAVSRVVLGGPWLGFALWFVGAAVVHDLLLYPLYALSDVAARREFGKGEFAATVRGVPWINSLRVPVGLSGLLLLIWAPLILQLPQGAYLGASGLSTSAYLPRWLLITGVLFLAAAVAFALRVRRAGKAAPGDDPPD